MSKTIEEAGETSSPERDENSAVTKPGDERPPFYYEPGKS
jgi:hypothetical protein